MSLSIINLECKKDHVNIGNKFSVNALSYAMIAYFDIDHFVVYQDNEKTGDIGVKIILGYDGNILSEVSAPEENDDIDYENEDYPMDTWNEMFENDCNHKELVDNPHIKSISYDVARYDLPNKNNKIDLEKTYPNFNSFPGLPKILPFEYEYTWDNYKLSVYESILYIISDCNTNEILNVLYAPSYDLQIGDCQTDVYLLDGHNLLIHNSGDVYSVIIITLIVSDK